MQALWSSDDSFTSFRCQTYSLGFGAFPEGFQSCFGLILPCSALISPFCNVYYVIVYCMSVTLYFLFHPFFFFNFNRGSVNRLWSLSRQFGFWTMLGLLNTMKTYKVGINAFSILTCSWAYRCQGQNIVCWLWNVSCKFMCLNTWYLTSLLESCGTLRRWSLAGKVDYCGVHFLFTVSWPHPRIYHAFPVIMDCVSYNCKPKKPPSLNASYQIFCFSNKKTNIMTENEENTQ